jgi:hypothetical protein
MPCGYGIAFSVYDRPNWLQELGGYLDVRGPESQPEIDRMEDLRALDPFFWIIGDGLREYTDREYFLDLLAEDVVSDFVITVLGYPRHVAGRGALIETGQPSTRCSRVSP